MSFRSVAVLYGGVSAEREISLQSGAAVISAVERLGLEVTALDLTSRSLAPLLDMDVDLAFIALHGGEGEDGRLQSVLDMSGVPYTGCGPLACAMAMDKVRSKLLWRGAGLPTEDFAQLGPDSDWEQVLAALGGQAIVKPAREGSSIGMSRARDPLGLREAYELASGFDSLVMAEKWIEGPEYSVGILGDEVLPIIQLIPNDEFYTYQAKYLSDQTGYLCPAPLDESLAQQIRDISLEAFRVMDGRGWGRVDLMLDADQNPWLLEINTVPGLTSHSLVPMAAAQAGYSFDELILRILQEAWHGRG